MSNLFQFHQLIPLLYLIKFMLYDELVYYFQYSLNNRVFELNAIQSFNLNYKMFSIFAVF